MQKKQNQQKIVAMEKSKVPPTRKSSSIKPTPLPTPTIKPERPLKTLAEAMAGACGIVENTPPDLAIEMAHHLGVILRASPPESFRWPTHKPTDLSEREGVPVLEDGCALVAFLCRADASHAWAKRLFSLVQPPLIISQETLNNVAILISKFSKRGIRLLQKFANDGTFIINNDAARGCNIAQRANEWLSDCLYESAEKARAKSVCILWRYGLAMNPLPDDADDLPERKSNLTCRTCGQEISEVAGPLSTCPRCSTQNAGTRWVKEIVPQDDGEDETED